MGAWERGTPASSCGRAGFAVEGLDRYGRVTPHQLADTTVEMAVRYLAGECSATTGRPAWGSDREDVDSEPHVLVATADPVDVADEPHRRVALHQHQQQHRPVAVGYGRDIGRARDHRCDRAGWTRRDPRSRTHGWCPRGIESLHESIRQVTRIISLAGRRGLLPHAVHRDDAHRSGGRCPPTTTSRDCVAMLVTRNCGSGLGAGSPSDEFRSVPQSAPVCR
jgi:hypothetical protein